MKGRVVLVLLGAALAAFLLMLLTVLGVPVDFASAWILLGFAVALLSRQIFFEEAVSWPPNERARTVRGSEVSRLAWAINPRTGIAGHVLVKRVERVLRRRLAHRGLDLDDQEQHQRIDALLGDGIRETLHREQVSRDDIERVLDAVEELSPRTEEKNRCQ